MTVLNFDAFASSKCSDHPQLSGDKNHNTINDGLGKPDDKLAEALLDFLNTVLKK